MDIAAMATFGRLSAPNRSPCLASMGLNMAETANIQTSETTKAIQNGAVEGRRRMLAISAAVLASF